MKTFSMAWIGDILALRYSKPFSTVILGQTSPINSYLFFDISSWRGAPVLNVVTNPALISFVLWYFFSGAHFFSKSRHLFNSSQTNSIQLRDISYSLQDRNCKHLEDFALLESLHQESNAMIFGGSLICKYN
jgi:hypothetical protein